MTDDVLENRLFDHAGVKQGMRRRPEPDWSEIAVELKKPGVTLQILWDEYRAVHPGGYGYSRFCELFRSFERRLVAKSEVMKRARRGEAIPEGWALDGNGQPTTDPDAALKGTMAPLGGYKGVGLALLTEVMAAALTGAMLGVDASAFSGTEGGPPKTGQFFVAILPDATSGGAFGERIARIAEVIKEQSGARLPGAGRYAARRKADANGVAVDPKILEVVRNLAAGSA